MKFFSCLAKTGSGMIILKSQIKHLLIFAHNLYKGKQVILELCNGSNILQSSLQLHSSKTQEIYSCKL